LLPRLPLKFRRRVARRLWGDTARLLAAARSGHGDRGRHARAVLDSLHVPALVPRSRFATRRNTTLVRFLLSALPYLHGSERQQVVGRLFALARDTPRALRFRILVRAIRYATGPWEDEIAIGLAVELFVRESALVPGSGTDLARKRLSAVLVGPAIERALAKARERTSVRERAITLAALIRWVPPENRTSLAAEAVSLSRRFETRAARVRLWYRLSIQLADLPLSAGLYRRAEGETDLGFALRSESATVLLRSLLARIPHLAGAERGEALRSAVAVTSGVSSSGVELLAELAGMLPQADAVKMVSTVLPKLRYDSAIYLGRWVDGKQLNELLKTMRIQRPEITEAQLAAFAKYVPGSLTHVERLRVNAYAANRAGGRRAAGDPRPFGKDEFDGLAADLFSALPHGRVPREALAEAALIVAQRPQLGRYSVVHGCLMAAARHSRSTLYELIESHAAVLGSLDPDSLGRVIAAMLKVQEWWP
jgi:hypothetical protein